MVRNLQQLSQPTPGLQWKCVLAVWVLGIARSCLCHLLTNAGYNILKAQNQTKGDGSCIQTLISSQSTELEGTRSMPGTLPNEIFKDSGSFLLYFLSSWGWWLFKIHLCSLMIINQPPSWGLHFPDRCGYIPKSMPPPRISRLPRRKNSAWVK